MDKATGFFVDSSGARGIIDKDGWEWEEGEAAEMSAGLAALSPETMLSAKTLAGVMGLCVRTVWRMVDRCELPKPIKIGKRGFWKAGRVLVWFDRLAEQGERETEKQLRKINDFA